MESNKDSGKGTGMGTFLETIRDMGDYRKCMGRLYFQLINTERNKGLLEKALYAKLLDLSMVCSIFLGGTEEGMVSATVTASLAGHWGVPAEEIMEQAVRNTPKLFPVKTGGLRSELSGYLSREERASLSREWGRSPEAYVMSNSYGTNGFGAVLYPGALKGLADVLGKDLYVLPSSRHETILLPADGIVAENELRGIVRAVNGTEVMEEDILSYHVYFYDREKNELRVTGKEDICAKL